MNIVALTLVVHNISHVYKKGKMIAQGSILMTISYHKLAHLLTLHRYGTMLHVKNNEDFI